ncbi:MAG: hypothetical protein HZB99_01130 [Candidatus Harrisonbacteria bacterium]|nr:hypothetical protein [Candidatus Harrisonbacteria bacterium]
MKRVIVVLCLLFGLAELSFADTSSSTLVWPDYKKNFIVASQEPFSAVPSNDVQDWKNKYITSVSVVLGSATAYLNDPFAPTMAVLEQSVLGHEAVIRVWLTQSRSGWVIVDLQLSIDGRWMSSRKGSLVRVYLLEPERLLKEGKITSVLLVLDPVGNGPPLKMRIENNSD